MIVPLSRTRWSRRLATTTVAVTTDHTPMAIDLTGPITAMATDGHIMGMDMDVVGAIKTDSTNRVGDADKRLGWSLP